MMLIILSIDLASLNLCPSIEHLREHDERDLYFKNTIWVPLVVYYSDLK